MAPAIRFVPDVKIQLKGNICVFVTGVGKGLTGRSLIPSMSNSSILVRYL